VLPAQTEEREMAEILLNKIWKRYPDGFEAVKELDLAIGDGEFMILVGPSGCGKSTALRMIAGLEGITQGELLIGGRRVNEVAPRDRDIAMVFQNYALYPHMTVRENMGFALKLAKVSKAEIDRKVSEAADVLELGPHLDRRPGQLSGGQRQRVAMGRAIVRDPKAFLMDEPLSNLDAKLRVQMRTQVSMLQRQLGTTMVYVTHDQTEAMTLGDRVAVMRSGVLQQVGSPKHLYEHPENLFVAGFIGSPAMNFLPARLENGMVKLPFGEARIPPMVKNAPRDVLAGVRPEHFEDARLSRDTPGLRFRVRLDVVESMGAELFVYFDAHGGEVHVAELDELAQDAGMDDVPGAGKQVVARLNAASSAAAGEDAELVLDTTQIKLFDRNSGRNLIEAS
jgi:multiple sugar transport system ATP-binding protein